MTFSARRQERRLREAQPLIVLGMHRSGTSLMVRLLADLGIHMGSWLSRDAESVHFQWLNRRIYGAAGSKWAAVEGLQRAMESAAFVDRQAEATRRTLFQGHPLLFKGSLLPDFFGRERWTKVCAGDALPWGWKDPRTTLTFPIWTRIFPNARWVHMVRNGVDVAISIHRRSQKQQRKLRNRLLPYDYSPATLDFGYCFRLWEHYLSFALAHQELIPPQQYMELRYEELLAEPEASLQRITAFAGFPVAAEALAAAARRVDAGRLDNSSYAAGYREQIPAMVDSPLMRRLGYGYSVSPEHRDLPR